MSERHRVFGNAQKQEKKSDPVTFDLLGETFTCKKKMPGAAILTFVHEADSGEGSRATDALVNFIKRCLKNSDERDRFEELYNREPPDSDDGEVDIEVVEIEDLGEIAGWLVEQYSGRPTPAQSS